jgi:hypothetical protein
MSLLHPPPYHARLCTPPMFKHKGLHTHMLRRTYSELVAHAVHNDTQGWPATAKAARPPPLSPNETHKCPAYFRLPRRCGFPGLAGTGSSVASLSSVPDSWMVRPASMKTMRSRTYSNHSTAAAAQACI